MKTRWRHGVRWLLAGVLVWAGALKALDPTAFAESIMGFNVVSWPVAVMSALYLPWLELATGVGLVVPRWRDGAALMAAVLFTLFTLLWAITWMRGIDVACGCFGAGAGAGVGVVWSFWRALGLAALAWVGACNSPDDHLASPSHDRC